MREDIGAFLAQCDLFAGLPVPLLSHVASQLEEVSLADGEVVFRSGDRGDAVYLVLEGRLSLQADGQVLLERRRGECVGEFALIDDEPRSATAVATGAAVLLRWEHRNFKRTLEANGAVARAVFRVLTRKLREDLDAGAKMQRLEHDLARANEIQMSMLPSGRWEFGDTQIAGVCAPASQVGEDYFDYLELPNAAGQVGLIVGDVTGHGFYSGLFVAMAKSCFHTQIPIDHAPQAVMQAMRTTLGLSIDRRLLMSCAYLVLNPAGRQLCFANAGHPPMLLLCGGDNELVRLAAIDPLLGVLDSDAQPDFGVERTKWQQGDLLFVYSDGLIEARGPEGQMFGLERLEQCIRGCAGLDAQAALEAVLGAVREFGEGAPVGDDRTLVVVRYQ